MAIKLSYHIFNESFYANTLRSKMPELHDYLDEVMVCIHRTEDDINDGIQAEFAIRWYNIGGVVPRIEMYGDSWPYLSALVPLLAELSVAGETATVPEVVAILKRLGAEDRTRRSIDKSN